MLRRYPSKHVVAISIPRGRDIVHSGNGKSILPQECEHGAGYPRKFRRKPTYRKILEESRVNRSWN